MVMLVILQYLVLLNDCDGVKLIVAICGFSFCVILPLFLELSVKDVACFIMSTDYLTLFLVFSELTFIYFLHFEI